MAFPTPEETIPIGSPSVSTANRFPRDRFLRDHGWSIYSRPKHGAARWRYRNIIVTEDEALEMEQYDRMMQKQKVVECGPQT